MRFSSIILVTACAICALTGAGGAGRAVAQITPTSNPSFAPKIGTAGNGSTPVVHIVTPSAGGVSHNKYQDFHVGGNGVILNNCLLRKPAKWLRCEFFCASTQQSTSGGQSQIGGAVSANPNLSGAAARVIVNEVERGGSRSNLGGTLEVFGQAADVIVANPNGISVNGGGFVNTPRVVLSTGEVKINGSGQVELRVEEGEIVIESSGMDASNVGEVNLVGKKVKIGGKTRARDRLEVSAGSQLYDHNSRESRELRAKGNGEYLIDAYGLGAMEAGKIFLKVTDEELGYGCQRIWRLREILR